MDARLVCGWVAAGPPRVACICIWVRASGSVRDAGLGRRPDDAHIIGNGSPIQRTRRARGATMALIERVTDYSVAQLKNDVVDYQQVVNLTTESGIKVSIAFPDNPPAEWLTFNGAATTVYLESGEFDRVHHLLQTEAPLYFSAL